MKISYSFIALVIMMPICIGYAYQSKIHWLHSHIEKPQIIQEEILPISTEPAVEEEPMSQLMTYQNALEASRKNGKKILLYFSGERFCEPCRRMKAMFADPSVQQALRKYIFYQIDVEGPEAIIARQKGVKGVPTYMIANSEDTILKTGVGYKGAASFLTWLNTNPMVINPIYRDQSMYWCDSCYCWHYCHPVTKVNVLRWVVSPRYRHYVKQQRYSFRDCA